LFSSVARVPTAGEHFRKSIRFPSVVAAIAGGNTMTYARRRFLRLAACAAVFPGLSPIARAQAYPSRPIRLVVPFPPGGAFDTLGRPLADKLKTLLGTVIVENIGGGGGSLGGAAVARARPDGYTLLLGGTVLHVNEAILKSRPQYNPIEDLDPISNVAVTTFAIAVHPAVPVRTLKELVDYAKANPGKVSYGSAGTGTINHLSGESLKLLAAIPDLIHVPYRGAGPALSDLIAGQIPMIVPAMTGQVLEFHRSGKLRILAVVSPTRLVGVPELPTAVEQGFPDLVAQQSVGLLAPAGTGKPIIDQIAQATRTALADPEYQRLLTESGFEPDFDSSPAKFRRSLDRDIARWTPIVKAIGLKID
jgi:tripartite-type tricarboxylate transporter receptor subunit TctC